MFENLLNSTLFSSIALTLIHFLWQGFVVAVILKVSLILVNQQKSKLRYALASTAMLANFVLPFVTFYILYQPDFHSVSNPVVDMTVDILGLSILATESSLSAELLTMLPYLTSAWLVTILLLTGRLILQIFSVNKLPKQGINHSYEELHERFLTLVEKLNLPRIPKLIISLEIDVPMAIGWLKPVVLVPSAMVTGLTPAQLDMLLLHELAHIRRHDYLVNLIQSFVEILLFFHPAVFWVSKQMRIEREYCSDDIAVGHCGNALAYAHTLADTASLTHQHRHAIPSMAMAATGGDLKQRVVRLVNHHHCTTTFDKSKWLASVLIVICFIILSSNQIAQFNNLGFNANQQPKLMLETIHSSLEVESTTTDKAAQTIIEQEQNNQLAQTTPTSDNSASQLTPQNSVNNFDDKNPNIATNTQVSNIQLSTAEQNNQINTLSPTTDRQPANATTLLTSNTTQALPVLDELSTNTQTTNTQDEYAQEVANLSSEPQYQDAIEKFDNTSAINNESQTALNEVIDTFKAAEVIHIIGPKYPSWAQRKKVELDLLVNFSINTEGRVRNIEIENKNKSVFFISSIKNAMKKWRFKPAEENGQAVESKMSKIFSFNLNNA